jgi:phosphatidylserine decarboxylase
LTAWCAYFFRDPVRLVPLREGLVVSPADGRISDILSCALSAERGLSRRR